MTESDLNKWWASLSLKQKQAVHDGPSGTKLTDLGFNLESMIDTTAEDIYNHYPRKVGKPAAIKAINKALKKTPVDTLLKLTKAYNKARQGQPALLTPHPATWFNQERYNDDPSTWRSVEPEPKHSRGPGNPFTKPERDKTPEEIKAAAEKGKPMAEQLRAFKRTLR